MGPQHLPRSSLHRVAKVWLGQRLALLLGWALFSHTLLCPSRTVLGLNVTETWSPRGPQSLSQVPEPPSEASAAPPLCVTLPRTQLKVLDRSGKGAGDICTGHTWPLEAGGPRG